ncbi:flippase-like domain-containing protein [Candidatus Microgenomates bacterium]|nr:flippase-like domain-containing protein [Candidatus Microgenomates bacterium]
MRIIKLSRFLLLAALIFIASIKLSPHFESLRELRNLWGDIRWKWVFVALIFQSGQYIGDGWLSQILLRLVDFRVNFKDTIKIASLSVFAAHLLPVGQAGAMAAIFHFYKKLGVNTGRIVFLSFAWGLISNLTLLFIFLASALFLPDAFLPSFHLPAFSLIAVGPLLSAGGILIIKRRSLITVLQKQLVKYAFTKKFLEYLGSWKHYKRSILLQPGGIFLAFVAASIYHLTNIATLAFAFIAFGNMPSIALLSFAYVVSVTAGLITFAPAGLGASEATLLLIFLNAGVEPKIAIGAVFIFRLLSFWLPIPMGFVSYLSLQRSKVRLPALHNF